MCIIALIWLSAIAFASAYDLDISLAVADEQSVFGRVLEVAGEPPAILFASFNLALMTAHFLKKQPRKGKDLILAALTLVGCVGTAVFTFNGIANYLVDYGIIRESVPLTALTAMLSLFTAAIFIAITTKMSRDAVERYFSAACHCVLAAAATLVIIWAFKLTWGRVRFRQLEGDLSRFTPWYLPQGFTGFFSFPSGHTANATVIFSVTYYLHFLPERYEKYKPLITALLAVWIILVALSRVLVGAHYLSDVLFGMAITLAIVYFAKPKE